MQSTVKPTGPLVTHPSSRPPSQGDGSRNDIERDLISAASASHTGTRPAWDERDAADIPGAIRLRPVKVQTRTGDIENASARSADAGALVPVPDMRFAVGHPRFPAHDIESVTKRAVAVFPILKLWSWINGLQRGGAYLTVALSKNLALTYGTLGVTAVVQFCTAYATVATGQLAEKILTGQEQSNVEADSRKFIMSVREVLAIVSQATSAGDMDPKIKVPLTAALTAVYGLMLLLDGVTELRQAHRNVTQASDQREHGYEWKKDTALLVKLTALATFLLLGLGMMGGSFAKQKQSQVHQWIFAIGAAIISADVIGGLSIVGDHFKQLNREYKYGNQIPRQTKLYDISMSIRSILGTVPQIISLTAGDTEHHALVTKILGGITNGVAALSGVMRAYSYQGMAQTHVRVNGSGINDNPDNTHAALDAYDRTLLGKTSAPARRFLAGRAQIEGSSETRDVKPRGW